MLVEVTSVFAAAELLATTGSVANGTVACQSCSYPRTFVFNNLKVRVPLNV